MRNLQDVNELQSLKAMGQLNRSGERRLEREEQRVMRDYNRGVLRGQRKEDQKFMSDTGATTSTAPATTTTTAVATTPTSVIAQSPSDKELLADMMRKNKASRTTTSVFDQSPDPFNFQ